MALAASAAATIGCDDNEAQDHKPRPFNAFARIGVRRRQFTSPLPATVLDPSVVQSIDRCPPVERRDDARSLGGVLCARRRLVQPRTATATASPFTIDWQPGRGSCDRPRRQTERTAVGPRSRLSAIIDACSSIADAYTSVRRFSVASLPVAVRLQPRTFRLQPIAFLIGPAPAFVYCAPAASVRSTRPKLKQAGSTSPCRLHRRVTSAGGRAGRRCKVWQSNEAWPCFAVERHAASPGRSKVLNRPSDAVRRLSRPSQRPRPPNGAVLGGGWRCEMALEGRRRPVQSSAARLPPPPPPFRRCFCCCSHCR
jgi:hypothetical protein